MTSEAITVHNSLLSRHGAAENAVTVLADLVGETGPRTERALRRLRLLQSLAPTFRVVVASDRELFDVVRPLHWPFEHVMAPEAAGALEVGGSHREYVERRVGIISAQFERVVHVRPSSDDVWLRRVARAARIPAQLVGVVMRSVPVIGDELRIRPMSEMLRSDLAFSGRYQGVSGEAVVGSWGATTGDLLVVGHAADDEVSSTHVVVPEQVQVIDVAFGPATSVDFERMVYRVLLQRFGARSAVLMPWRAKAASGSELSTVVDAVVELRSDALVAVPRLCERLTRLAGSAEFSWEVARAAGAVRSIASRMAS